MNRFLFFLQYIVLAFALCGQSFAGNLSDSLEEAERRCSPLTKNASLAYALAKGGLAGFGLGIGLFASGCRQALWPDPDTDREDGVGLMLSSPLLGFIGGLRLTVPYYKEALQGHPTLLSW